uniref:Uncharacterized protein n=1 Tax=Arundo donax TaxID=35708 RepID=A0A0A9V8U8_ARUDO
MPNPFVRDDIQLKKELPHFCNNPEQELSLSSRLHLLFPEDILAAEHSTCFHFGAFVLGQLSMLSLLSSLSFMLLTQLLLLYTTFSLPFSSFLVLTPDADSHLATALTPDADSPLATTGSSLRLS